MFGSLAEPRSGAAEMPSGIARASDAALQRSIRSKGQLDLAFIQSGTSTVLARRGQAGCLRVHLPRVESQDEMPCPVIINTAGGITGGDRLDQHLSWGQETAAIATTQAAEKVYRSLSSDAVITTELAVERGARAEWLPQETILFDRARLHRETRVVLSEGASFLGVEAVVLGRKAMGEKVRKGLLLDRMQIRRCGRLVYSDVVKLDGDIAARLSSAATGNRASAMAVIILVAEDAATRIDAVRSTLEEALGLTAASTWNGLLAVRLLAPDSETLRHDIALALAPLRGGRSLPRVWRC